MSPILPKRYASAARRMELLKASAAIPLRCHCQLIFDQHLQCAVRCAMLTVAVAHHSPSTETSLRPRSRSDMHSGNRGSQVARRLSELLQHCNQHSDKGMSS